LAATARRERAGVGLERHPVTAESASFRLWLSFLFVLLSFGFGVTWDRSWHTHHKFNDFYSPPHIFIYTTFGLAALAFLSLAMSPERRAWFGASIKVPLAPFETPAPLFLALAGFGTVMLGGTLDMLWHNTFGLDETNWSTPHSMIGWGLCLTWLGFLSSRFALARHIPISRPFLLFGGFLSVSFIVSRALGALENYQTQDVARALGSLNVLASSSAFQHTLRIVEKYNLTHSNPLFVPLAALGAGAGLAFLWDLFALPKRPPPLLAPSDGLIVRQPQRLWRAIQGVVGYLARGKVGFLVTALIATLLSYSSAHGRAVFLDGKVPALHLLDDPRNFLPLPFIVAASVYLLASRFGTGERLGWALAGFVFGVVTAAFWDQSVGVAVVAAPLMAFGALLGRRLFTALRQPAWPQVRALTAIALGAPALTGVADLFMRWTTP
jgi:hypothetical protein